MLKERTKPDKFEPGQLWKLYDYEDLIREVGVDYSKYVYIVIKEAKPYLNVVSHILKDTDYISRHDPHKNIKTHPDWTLSPSLYKRERFRYLGKYNGCLKCSGLE